VFTLLALPPLALPVPALPSAEPDEGRYARSARDAGAGEWVVPLLQGEPYLDKPPLFYWLVMLSYTLFVCTTGGAAGAALAVHATVLTTYLGGAGWWASGPPSAGRCC